MEMKVLGCEHDNYAPFSVKDLLENNLIIGH